MRTLMKAITATLILFTFTLANEKAVDTEKINKNLIMGLTHNNTGVVESTIRVVILMKIEYPEAEYDDIIDQLEELIMEGATKNIRIKSLIASDYLNNFEQYSWLKNAIHDEGDQLFDAYLNSISLTGIDKTN